MVMYYMLYEIIDVAKVATKRIIKATPRSEILSHYKLMFLFFIFSRSLPKLPTHEEEGVHQNPQYTGQHHFHPVPHDHDYCERVVINVRNV